MKKKHGMPGSARGDGLVRGCNPLTSHGPCREFVDFDKIYFNINNFF